MAFFDKLMFWKKKEPDFSLDAGMGFGADMDVPGLNLGLPGGSNPAGFEMPGEQKPDFGFAKPADMQRDEIPAEVRNAPAFGGAFNPQPQQQQQAQGQSSHETQVIYSKLDSIKSALETIDLRLKNIEKIEETKEKERARW